MSHVLQSVGDRLPSLSRTFEIDGEPVNLTGATVTFFMRLATSATLKVNNQAAVLVDAPTGAVRYDWAALDVDTDGFYVGWFQATVAGKTEDSDEFVVWIRPHAMAQGSLCAVDQVREYLQKPGSDRKQDPIIAELIRRASKAISRHCSREFVAVADATRQFHYEPNSHGRLDLFPYDLRSLQAPGYVKLHPESSSPATLTADQDFALEPIGQPDGIWSTLFFSSQLSIASDYLRRFGKAKLEIRGAWGYPFVPDDVEQAAIITVGIWMRRDVQAFNTAFNLEAGFLERPEALPSAVKGMLKDFRHPGLA